MCVYVRTTTVIAYLGECYLLGQPSSIHENTQAQTSRAATKKKSLTSFSCLRLLTSNSGCQAACSNRRRILDLAAPGMFKFKFTKKVQAADILFEH